jgi:FeS assembly SUF system protein
MGKLSVVNEAPAPKKAPTYAVAESPFRYERDLSTEQGRIRDRALQALRSVRDPEIPLNIVDLGLIYALDVDDGQTVRIRMTLTAPNCPVAQSMPEEIRSKAAAVDGAHGAEIEVVWDPPWHKGMMSEAARLELNI